MPQREKEKSPTFCSSEMEALRASEEETEESPSLRTLFLFNKSSHLLMMSVKMWAFWLAMFWAITSELERSSMVGEVGE